MDTTYRQDVSAVIVNYGSGRDAIELAGKLASEIDTVLVVDNSGELGARQDLPGNARVLVPGRNIGFGAAVNLAAAQTTTRWLLILNPDVRLKRHCLKHLVEASRQLHAPLCGPRFYWDEACTLQLPPALGHPLWLLSDRHIQHSSLAGVPDLTALAIARHEHFWREQAPFSEPVLSGACMLADRRWFQDNDMAIFDEDFFLYYEDTDLCGRLMRKGVMPVCVPGARAVHFWNQSAEPPEGKAELMRASERKFLEKYYPNGAPPLPPSIEPVFEALGSFTKAPVLALPAGTAHVDIGVQGDFIVFARSNTSKNTFTFTRSMWKRLRGGGYYMRARGADGTVKAHWHWSKTA